MEYKEENIFEMKTYNIATILLNYNSEEDLFESVMQLLVQKKKLLKKLKIGKKKNFQMHFVEVITMSHLK